jgi:hypothetical protein
MNINKYLVKGYEKKPFKELVNAPIHALAGISEKGGVLLNEALPNVNIKTIGDLAKLKYVKWAKAICELADGEE